MSAEEAWSSGRRALTGTAIAIGRTIIAIMENHQRADGRVAVPKVLRPHMGKDVIGD